MTGDVVVKKTKKAVIFSAVQIIRIVNLLAGENWGETALGGASEQSL